MGLLFGDILAVNKKDLFLYVSGALILITLKIIWKPLFASTVNYELAEAEGLNPDKKAVFSLIGCNNCHFNKISWSFKITGMLIICYG